MWRMYESYRNKLWMEYNALYCKANSWRAIEHGNLGKICCREGQWEGKRTLPSTPRRDTKRPRNNQTEECVRWFSQARWMYSLVERRTFDTLVNFCWHKIGLTADIEKAFLMVGINETDRDMLRFLWFKDPDDLNSEIVHLKFTGLVFGLRPSPGISTSTIQHHLDSQVTEEFKPHFIELLKKSLYVHDLVTGKGREAKVLELCWKSESLMQQGGFNLRKWNTNSKSARGDQWTERPRESNNWTWKHEDHYWRRRIVRKTTNGPPIAADNTSENAII